MAVPYHHPGPHPSHHVHENAHPYHIQMRVGVPASYVLQQDAENHQICQNFLPQTMLHLPKKKTNRQARNEYDKTIQETEAMGENTTK